MNRYVIGLVLIAVLLISNNALAQTSHPEDVAREYFRTMQAEGMTSIGSFMHPQALRDFKQMLIPVYEFEAESGQRQLMDLTFGQLATIADLRRLSPAAFMNGFMRLVAAELGDVKISFDKLEILGTIAEGEARHVLTRMTVGAGDLAVTQFEVLSFLPYGEGWRLQLNGKMKGMAKVLRSSIGRG